MPESTLKDFFFWTGILARAAVLMAKDRPGLFFVFLFFWFFVFFWVTFFFCGTGVGRIPGCLNRTVPNESTKWPHRPL